MLSTAFHVFLIGGSRVCGMDEFSVAVSVVGRDRKDKETVELVDDLNVTAEDQHVSYNIRIVV